MKYTCMMSFVVVIVSWPGISTSGKNFETFSNLNQKYDLHSISGCCCSSSRIAHTKNNKIVTYNAQAYYNVYLKTSHCAILCNRAFV